LHGEVKWSSVTGLNLSTYKLLVDTFFHLIRNSNLIYRQIFLDRAFVHVSTPSEAKRSDLDVQFLICYQFLKHHFGLRYLPATDPLKDHHVSVRLDNHSSQRHKDELVAHMNKLSSRLNQPRLFTTVQFVNSERFLRLQLCDLLMGAAGSHGNKWHLRREGSRRGMKPKQKCRHEMALYIYEHFRRLDAAERGSKAFNWFESTGTDGDQENYLKHKLRIWKFKPKRYQLDEGWQNKNLDSQGLYLGPKIDAKIHEIVHSQNSQ
jgi:hypothetical protein